ncbi:MAG TPA: hypothetical protein VGD26_02205 [Chitinophagaceae bacterium]
MTVRSGLYILMLAWLSACTDDNDTNTSINTVDTASQKGTKQLYDFAVYKNDFGMPLKAWAHELQLEANLGKPLSESVIQLGPGADTHMGAYIKQLDYEGLKILLYAPRTPDSAWIMKMVVTGDAYTTARGMKTGVDTGRITEYYPEALKWPDGKRDQSSTPYYISNESEQLYLRLYVSIGKVDSMVMYHDLP